jgi:hypothetical protein
VLPSEKTETGTWSLAPLSAAGAPPSAITDVPISFAIPLENEIAAANVHRIEIGGTPTADCPGTAANPEAKTGHLCVYVGVGSGEFEFSNAFPNIYKVDSFVQEGASKSGATLAAFIGAEARVKGTWAVTAP